MRPSHLRSGVSGGAFRGVLFHSRFSRHPHVLIKQGDIVWRTKLCDDYREADGVRLRHAPAGAVMDRHRRLILTTIVAVGAVVRFYRLDLTWFFLDHVRDVSTATAIAAGTSFPLLGPRVGWAEAYLGPLYFYLLAIPFSIARDP